MLVKINQSGLDDENLIVRKYLIPIKERIISQIAQNPKGTVFYYDFSKVKGINASGVDEIIAKVVKYLIENEEDKFLFLTNLMEDLYEHRFNIDYSLNRLEVGIVERTKTGETHFLGKISDAHRELLNHVYLQKEVTARAISDQFDKKITLVSTHLNKLYSLRLIRRREEQLTDGGRQFIYESLF